MRFFEGLARKLGGRRKLKGRPARAPEAWNLVTLDDVELGQTSLVRVRLEKPDVAGGRRLDTAVLVQWRYEAACRGLPDAATTEHMATFEGALDGLGGGTGVELVLVRTGCGVRDWLFYAHDRVAFTRRFEACLARRERYPIELSFVDDPEWALWSKLTEDTSPRPG